MGGGPIHEPASARRNRLAPLPCPRRPVSACAATVEAPSRRPAPGCCAIFYSIVKPCPADPQPLGPPGQAGSGCTECTEESMKTIGALWERNAQARPEGTALVFEDDRLTHGDVYKQARRLASALYGLGVRKQDRVSMLAMNRAEWFTYYGACHISGFIAGTVNFRLAPVEIGYILKDSSPRVLIFEEQYVPVLEAVRAELTSIEHFICIGRTPQWARSYEALVDSGLPEGAPTRPQPGDCAHLIYTSGTTGRPKGAMRSQFAEIRLAQEIAGELNLCGTDRMLLMMPLFHIGALAEAIATLYAGGTVVLHRKFDPLQALSAVQGERITHTHMAPTMVQAVLDVPGVNTFDLSSLRVFCYAAAPMPVPVLRRAIDRLGPVFVNQYGGTEMGAATQLHSYEHHLDGDEARRLASVGRAFP